MARPKSLKPAYCIDAATDRAYVRIDGHKTYLGSANTRESRDAYDRVIGEWTARGRASAALTQPQPEGDGGLNVNQVLAAFWAHAETAYPCGA